MQPLCHARLTFIVFQSTQARCVTTLSTERGVRHHQECSPQRHGKCRRVSALYLASRHRVKFYLKRLTRWQYQQENHQRSCVGTPRRTSRQHYVRIVDLCMAVKELPYIGSYHGRGATISWLCLVFGSKDTREPTQDCTLKWVLCLTFPTLQVLL